MGINKVNYGNTTLIDTSNVTVSTDTLMQGYTALDNTGTLITGTATPSLRELTVTPTNAVQVFYPSGETFKGTITYSGTVYGSSDRAITHSLNLTSGNLYRVDGYFSYLNVTQYVTGTYACGTDIYSTSSWKLTLNTNDLVVHNYGTRYDSFSLYIDVYSIDEYYDGFSKVTVNAATGGGVGTKTVENTSSSNTSLAFSSLSGEPKAFFVRLTTQLTRSSSYTYYYITAVRYNGTNTYGNYWRMSNGTFYADTSHYSFTYSSGTLTVSSSASRSSAGGSFYAGDYELTYVY